MTAPKTLPKTKSEIINMSLAACDKQTKCLVIMEEFARGEGDVFGLVEEMADVIICIDQLKKLAKIYDSDLNKAVEVKLLREYERRK